MPTAPDQLKFLASTFAVLTLLGCAPMDVKDIVEDTPNYLDKTFTAAQLPTEVRKQASSSHAAPRFRTIKIKFNYQVENSVGEKILSTTSNNLYKDLGNGLIQLFGQDANNDLVFSRYYGLTYAGAIELRAQMVLSNKKTANFITEVKSYKTFASDIATAQENSIYDYDWNSGTAIQIAGYIERKKHCVTGKAFPASQLYASLPGTAFDMDCELISNGSASYRQHYVFLQQYGLAVLMGSTYANRKITDTITSVEIQ